MKILIDNGHGIDTNGKCSPDKRLYEYKYAREISAAVVAELRALGYDAELIVPETKDVSLPQRVKRINNICAKLGSKNVLLVSIHNNAAGADGKWHDARGFSVFVSKNSSDASKRCAARFTRLARDRGLLGNRSVPAGDYWTWSWTKADIYILKASHCPAVLTENFFQDNRADVDFLLSPDGRQKVIDLHVDAITDYIKQLQK